MAKIEDIQNLVKQINSSFTMLNNWASEGVMPISDLVYPSHDGKEEAIVVCNIIELHFALQRMQRACEISLNQIKSFVEDKI